jgi:hypothetical protein
MPNIENTFHNLSVIENNSFSTTIEKDDSLYEELIDSLTEKYLNQFDIDIINLDSEGSWDFENNDGVGVKFGDNYSIDSSGVISYGEDGIPDTVVISDGENLSIVIVNINNNEFIDAVKVFDGEYTIKYESPEFDGVFSRIILSEPALRSFFGWEIPHVRFHTMYDKDGDKSIDTIRQDMRLWFGWQIEPSLPRSFDLFSIEDLDLLSPQAWLDKIGDRGNK